MLSAPTVPHFHSNRAEVIRNGGRAALRAETFNREGAGRFALHIRVLRPLGA